jgi:hypothetical protein
MKLYFIAIILIIVISSLSYADESLPETISHPESKCIVQTSGGEYPKYVVKKEGKVIFSPKSDGIIKAVFSLNGKYIAFSGSEIDWVDVEDKSYSVVVLHCESGVLKGFIDGFPSGEDSKTLSWINDKTIRYIDTTSEKEVILDVKSEPDGSFKIEEKKKTKK